jgi:hypothetical protein
MSVAAFEREPLSELLGALQALQRGEDATPLSEDLPGIHGEVARAFNKVLVQRRQTPGRSPRVRANGRTHWDDHAAELLNGLLALKSGDATVKLPVTWNGLPGKIAEAFNAVVALNNRTTAELARLSRVVGKEGKLKQRANLGDVLGFWHDNVEALNSLMEDLVHPSSEVARVIGAVAQGDLSKGMALEVEGRPLEGEFLRTAKTINTMV